VRRACLGGLSYTAGTGGRTLRAANPRGAREFCGSRALGLQVASRKIDQENLGGAAAIQRSKIGARVVWPYGAGRVSGSPRQPSCRESNLRPRALATASPCRMVSIEE